LILYMVLYAYMCVFAHSRFVENPPIWSWETNPSFLRCFCHRGNDGARPLLNSARRWEWGVRYGHPTRWKGVGGGVRPWLVCGAPAGSGPRPVSAARRRGHAVWAVQARPGRGKGHWHMGPHGTVPGSDNGSKFFKPIQLILNDFKPFKL
jgi:hypothetical protein